MTPQQLILAGVIVFNLVLIGVLRFKPEMRVAARGKALAFLALFVLPVLAFTGGTAHHLE